MKTLVKIVALTAAMAVASTSALASDGKLNKQASAARTEKAVASSSASPFYVKGLVGYNFSQKATLKVNGKSTVYKKNSMKFGVGAGYEVYENLRAELMLNFIPSSHFKVKNTNITKKISLFNPMLNMHYDIANMNGFTPFVSAGLGLTKISGDLVKGTTMSYMAGAGVAYQISNDVTAELAYNYNYYGKAKIKNIANAKVKLAAHSVNAGIRIKL